MQVIVGRWAGLYWRFRWVSEINFTYENSISPYIPWTFSIAPSPNTFWWRDLQPLARRILTDALPLLHEYILRNMEKHIMLYWTHLSPRVQQLLRVGWDSNSLVHLRSQCWGYDDHHTILRLRCTRVKDPSITMHLNPLLLLRDRCILTEHSNKD